MQEPSKRAQGQAPGLPSQLETEESELQKTEIFTTYFTRARTHMRAVEGFPAAPENIPRQKRFPRPPSPLRDPGEPSFPLKYCWMLSSSFPVRGTAHSLLVG